MKRVLIHQLIERVRACGKTAFSYVSSFPYLHPFLVFLLIEHHLAIVLVWVSVVMSTSLRSTPLGIFPVALALYSVEPVKIFGASLLLLSQDRSGVRAIFPFASLLHCNFVLAVIVLGIFLQSGFVGFSVLFALTKYAVFISGVVLRSVNASGLDRSVSPGFSLTTKCLIILFSVRPLAFSAMRLKPAGKPRTLSELIAHLKMLSSGTPLHLRMIAHVFNRILNFLLAAPNAARQFRLCAAVATLTTEAADTIWDKVFHRARLLAVDACEFLRYGFYSQACSLLCSEWFGEARSGGPTPVRAVSILTLGGSHGV